ncbi:MAG TPA: thiamine phosphate synthase [Bauldia sp.]
MRPGVDLRLMLVTDTALSQPRGLIATVLAAVAGGVTIVQLRDKHATDIELAVTAAWLRDELAGTGVALIVNDRPQVTLEAGLSGVHIGQSDGHPAAARALLGPDALIGLSVTSPDEIDTVDPDVVDYVGLGPVFATSTKPDAAAPLGLEGMHIIGERLPVPYIAIGGITLDNAAATISAGASGVAVVSAIAGALEPRSAALALRRAIDTAQGA